MRDEDWFVQRKTPDHDGGIRTAANLWCSDRAAAKARYGPIASWDVSEVRNIAALFCGRAEFNDDISRWDVSNVESISNLFDNAFSFNQDISDWDVGKVTHMNGAFLNAKSFTHQLGGSWVTSTACKSCMFRNCIAGDPRTIVPGGIAGKAKDPVDGTVEPHLDP